jgi:hypothetical protein
MSPALRRSRSKGPLTALCRDRKAAGQQCKITDALRISLKETALSGFLQEFDASFVQAVPEPDPVGVPRVEDVKTQAFLIRLAFRLN